MAAAAGGRSSVFIRRLSRTTHSFSPPFRFSSSLLHSQSPTRISGLPFPFSWIRREALCLSSLMPIHTAVASARLVSKLPKEASMSTEGRFANYISPI